MQLFQFIGAAVGSSIVAAVISLVWPLVTTSAMPPVLTKVRDIVIQTPVGKEVSTVLGVSDLSSVSPINFSDVVTKQATQAVGFAETSIKNSVSITIIKQFVTRFDLLPDDQKQVVRASICSEPTPTVTTTQ